jgi:hypothetical protein
MDRYLALKANDETVYAVTMGGVVLEFDPVEEEWKPAKMNALLKKWAEVEMEWHKGVEGQ